MLIKYCTKIDPSITEEVGPITVLYVQETLPKTMHMGDAEAVLIAWKRYKSECELWGW